jgi:hypothetical protein
MKSETRNSIINMGHAPEPAALDILALLTAREEV